MNAYFRRLFDDNLNEIKKALLDKSYELLEDGFIGSGGFSVVYKVKETITRDIYAVKIIFRGNEMNSMESKRLQEQVMSEIEIMEKYGSLPFMMPLTSYDIREKFILLIMEYCPNGSLEAYIKGDQKLDENRLKVVIQQILIGINNLHKNGKLHRDIKPENILIDRHGEIRIADLGLAYDSSGKSTISKSSTAGTDRYLSPEVYDCSCGQSVKSDTWAIGIVLLELIFGKKQLPNSILLSLTPKKVMKIFNNSPDTRDMSDLSDFVSQCVNGIKKRFDTTQLLSHKWLANVQQIPAFLNDAMIIVDNSSVLISNDHQFSNYDGQFKVDYNQFSNHQTSGGNNPNINPNSSSKNNDEYDKQLNKKNVEKNFNRNKGNKNRKGIKKQKNETTNELSINDNIDNQNNIINLNTPNNKISNMDDDSNSVSDLSIINTDISSDIPKLKPISFPPPDHQQHLQQISGEIVGPKGDNLINKVNQQGSPLVNHFFPTSTIENNRNMIIDKGQSQNTDNSGDQDSSYRRSSSNRDSISTRSDSDRDSESDSNRSDIFGQNTIDDLNEKHMKIENNFHFDDSTNTLSRPSKQIINGPVSSDVQYMDDIIQRITQKFGFLDDLNHSDKKKFKILIEYKYSEPLVKETEILDVINRCMKGDTTMTFVDYDFNELTTGFWDPFSAALKLFPSLFFIFFEKCNLTDYAFSSISLSFSTLTDLKELQFCHNRITDKGIFAFSHNVKYLQNLEFLDLRENEITSTGCKYLSDGFKYLTSLKILNLSKNNCGEAGMNYLSCGMKNMIFMEILLFDSNEINDGGLLSLSSNFMLMKDLAAVSISNNNISYRGMDQFLSNTRMISQIKSLVLSKNKLDDSTISQISERIDNFHHLEKLAIDDNNLTDRSIGFLTKCFQFTKNLLVLSIGGNQITDSGVISLSQNLNYLPLLYSLKINHSHLTDTCMDSLSFNLHFISKLEKLHLNNNNFSDKGMSSLSRRITDLRCLRELNLQDNTINNEGFSVLFLQLVKISSIESVNFMDNYITEESQNIINSERRYKRWKFFSTDSRYIPETLQLQTCTSNQLKNKLAADQSTILPGKSDTSQQSVSSCCYIL